ncbi:MAG: AAA family ATPase [Treponema sp.]|nr:AAA family ATPase [Treponema sp.]
MVTINSKELYEVLAKTPAEQNIMLAGKHGIGKSQILTHYYESNGIPVISLFLGQMSDPGDLIGLPDRNSTNQTTTFLPPFWFPQNEKPVVLFLDELNRARPEILQSVMDLALNKKIAGRSLPKGSIIISAVNNGDEYQITDLDPALISRFNIYDFRPSVREWLLWAEKNMIDVRIISFIQKNPSDLDGDSISVNDEQNLEKTPDRRGWEKVSNIIKTINSLSKTDQKIIAGIIGSKTTARFFSSLNNSNLLSAEDILGHFSEHTETLKTYKTPELALLNDEIYRYLETQNPVANAGKNLLAYGQWLKKSKKNEALAHLASNFTDPNYETAKEFIVSECNELYLLFIDFIQNM